MPPTHPSRQCPAHDPRPTFVCHEQRRSEHLLWPPHDPQPTMARGPRRSCWCLSRDSLSTPLPHHYQADGVAVGSAQHHCSQAAVSRTERRPPRVVRSCPACVRGRRPALPQSPCVVATGVDASPARVSCHVASHGAQYTAGTATCQRVHPRQTVGRPAGTHPRCGTPHAPSCTTHQAARQ